jgi:hypothetical protein
MAYSANLWAMLSGVTSSHSTWDFHTFYGHNRIQQRMVTSAKCRACMRGTKHCLVGKRKVFRFAPLPPCPPIPTIRRSNDISPHATSLVYATLILLTHFVGPPPCLNRSGWKAVAIEIRATREGSTWLLEPQPPSWCEIPMARSGTRIDGDATTRGLCNASASIATPTVVQGAWGA